MAIQERVRFASGVLAIAAPVSLFLFHAVQVIYRIKVDLAANSGQSYFQPSITNDDTAVFICMLALMIAGIIAGIRWIRESHDGPERPVSILPTEPGPKH